MDYLDVDVAYLLGLITARGQLLEKPGDYRIIIQFPSSSTVIKGIQSSFNQSDEIKLGLVEIGNRLRNLLETDVDISAGSGKADHMIVISFRRRNMMWRNLRLIFGEASHYGSFQVPKVIQSENTPSEYVREYLRGFADVAGNVRPANRYIDGRHRVRLDILNYKENWQLPVQLCQLLQNRLEVPVQMITWGHPNMRRGFREHQLNIFVLPFLKIGFTFRHKHRLLEEFVQQDKQKHPDAVYAPCPGERMIRVIKDSSDGEHDAERLPSCLVGKHFDGYWQICRALGCPRRPTNDEIGLLEDLIDEDTIRA